MELLLILLIGLAVGSYAYRTGKQTGSRQGYIAGRRRQRLPRP